MDDGLYKIIGLRSQKSHKNANNEYISHRPFANKANKATQAGGGFLMAHEHCNAK